MSASPIVLAAGGTGGHVFPARALAAELARRGWPLAIFTDGRGTAWRDGGAARIHRIAAAGIAGPGLARRLRGLALLGLGTVQALWRLARLRPAAVVGFGGYPSLPTMLAAIALGRATVIHDQNAVLGRVNRLLARWCRAIATSFEPTQGLPGKAGPRIVLTGNPVRQAVRAAASLYIAPRADAPLRLLVFGGSQGARVFTETVPAALGGLPASLGQRLRLVMQCRAEDLAACRERLDKAGVDAEVAPFFDDLPARIAAADLIVARAGGGTIAEICAIGRPALLVPLPGAMDDHQRRNAAALAGAGAAWTIDESDLTPDRLAAEIADLFDHPDRLQRTAARAASLARSDADRRLADLVERVAGGGS